jgi:hypothetical protein
MAGPLAALAALPALVLSERPELFACDRLRPLGELRFFEPLAATPLRLPLDRDALFVFVCAFDRPPLRGLDFPLAICNLFSSIILTPRYPSGNVLNQVTCVGFWVWVARQAAHDSVGRYGE